MKIAIASDHGGYQLKEEIKKYLEDETSKWWIWEPTQRNL